MYDHVLGEVVRVHPARAVVRAGGVGYDLRVPLGTSRALQAGQQATLYTLLHVVDGAPTLLGFASRKERELARELMTVSGVGPSICLAILSVLGPEPIAAAIVAGDSASLRQVKGVGSKTAERLCLELRDRVARLDLAGAAGSGHEPVVAILPASHEDAIAALVVLGYSEKDARARVVRTVEKGAGGSTTEELIRAVLAGG